MGARLHGKPRRTVPCPGVLDPQPQQEGCTEVGRPDPAGWLLCGGLAVLGAGMSWFILLSPLWLALLIGFCAVWQDCATKPTEER